MTCINMYTQTYQKCLLYYIVSEAKTCYQRKNLQGLQYFGILGDLNTMEGASKTLDTQE